MQPPWPRVHGHLGGGRVKSLFAPYINTRSDEPCLRLLEVQGLDTLNPPAFDTPAGRLVFDEIPESYFAYFRESAD